MGCGCISRGPWRRWDSPDAVSSVARVPELPEVSETSLDGVWVVTRYLHGDEFVEPKTTANEAVLTIQGESISGTMGVNRFAGRLEEGLPNGPMAVTRMAGPPEAMAQEDTLLDLLQGVDHIEVSGAGMWMSRDGLTTIEFNRSGTAE